MEPNALKKGSAQLLILSLLEAEPRHGYHLARLIESRSRGTLRFSAGSLYPVLYKLERDGLIQGRWVEAPGTRRRRFYRLTAAGKRVLASQRKTWKQFADAIMRVTRPDYA